MSHLPPKGKMLNPALARAVEDHRAWKRENGISCSLESPNLNSAKAHNNWRMHFKNHTGYFPPRVWIDKPAEPEPPAPEPEKPIEQPTLFDYDPPKSEGPYHYGQ
jgi:hypothetical protein